MWKFNSPIKNKYKNTMNLIRYRLSTLICRKIIDWFSLLRIFMQQPINFFTHSNLFEQVLTPTIILFLLFLYHKYLQMFHLNTESLRFLIVLSPIPMIFTNLFSGSGICIQSHKYLELTIIFWGRFYLHIYIKM